MWNEFYAQQPCSIGLLTWPTGRFTLVVKGTLRVPVELAPRWRDSAAQLQWSDAPEAPSLDVSDASGTLVYPSDFAPYKPACDVVVTGAEVAARGVEGSIAIGRAEKRAAPRVSLGARETFCPGGDPTDPAAMRVWGAPNADFSRFQTAAPDQRVAFPRPPFTLQYRRGEVGMNARFDGPEPVIKLLDRASRAIVSTLPLALDTVLLAPREAKVTLVWRTVSSWPTPPTLLVVDFATVGAAPGYPFGGRVIEPRMVRAERAPTSVGEATLPEETRALDPAIGRKAALPFGPPSSRPQGTQLIPAIPATADDPPRSQPKPSQAPSAETRLVPALPPAEETFPTQARAKAMTLPFRRLASTPPPERRETLDAQSFAELRQGPAVPSAWETSGDTHVARPRAMTQAARALPSSPGAPPPSVPAPSVEERTVEVSRTFEPSLPTAPQRGLGMAPLGVSPPPLVSASAAPAPPPSRPSAVVSPSAAPAPPSRPSAVAVAAPADAPRGPSEETMKAIQREVWKGERPLAQILQEYGVTESDWREAKRARGKR